MNEFLNLIYNSYIESDDAKNTSGEMSYLFHKKLEDFIHPNLLSEISKLYFESLCEVDKNAFIQGFQYACKCLSNGKIEF